MNTQAKRNSITNQSMAMLVVILVLAAGFAYYYVSASNQSSSLNNQISLLTKQVSSLNETIASQERQISSLTSEVPNSQIFGVAYTMTLWSRVDTGLSARAFSTIWDLGLRYHTGQQVTLYIDASQLFNFTGLMNITAIRPQGGFSVSSISPSLPITVNSGGIANLTNRSILTVVLNTDPNWYNGFLQVYIQAWTS